jgi:hypothetical protein
LHFQSRQRFINLPKFMFNCGNVFELSLLPAVEQLLLTLEKFRSLTHYSPRHAFRRSSGGMRGRLMQSVATWHHEEKRKTPTT